jgi:hypothetical protein
MPMPVIDGRRATWICEFCYAMLFEDRLPDSWDWVWQSAICPDCQEKVARAGGVNVVLSGDYADGPDPRAVAPPN